MLQKKANASAEEAAGTADTGKRSSPAGGSPWGEIGDILVGTGGGRRQSVAEAAVKSVVRSVGSSLGRALVRGVLGGLRR